MSKELIGSHSVHETLVRQTQIDAARIEELEQQLLLKGHHYSVIKAASELLAANCDALQADNARLRGALNTQLNDCINFNGGQLTICIMEASTAALASTPEQSLAEYRNKVIEAFVNEFSRHVGGDGEFWLHELQDFAMNEQP